MSPTRLLLFSVLGLGGLLVFAGTASAAEEPSPDNPKPSVPPAPKPTGTTAAAAQQGGQGCQEAFQEWSALASRAAQLCAEAAVATDNWWSWEELRLAGDERWNPEDQERARARWEEAQDNCNDINSDSLAAMARYESCMVSLGLNPRLPSGATY